MHLNSVSSSITPIKEQPIAELMAASAVQSRVVNIAKNIGSSDKSLSQSLPATANGWTSPFAVRYDNDEEDDDWIEVTSGRRSLRVRSATTEDDGDYDEE
ncbi:unnamed protein product [Sphagnum balticum]